MSEIKHIDYVGFTFNGVHSSSLGIVRISDGSRFNENLLPTVQDKTVQVPGGDGMYHFGGFYTQRQFNVSYAFDSLTEEQLAKIKELFGDKKIHELIFDESPYKKYYAKVVETASIKHIPFSEGATNRVYKGEGNIQFAAYDPYAYSTYKYLDQFPFQIKDNSIEWKDAAGLLSSQGNYDIINGNQIKLYNPGVRDTDFVLSLKFIDGKISGGQIYVSTDGTTKGQLNLKAVTSINGDEEIRINTKLNLIEGYKDGRKTGNIYNKYISAGTFFKIPVSKNMIMYITMSSYFKNIEYDYIYF